MIEFTNLEEFTSGILAYCDEVERDWEAELRTITRRILTALAETSPQWTGNFAANWYVMQGEQSRRYAWWNKDPSDTGARHPEFFRGDQPAVMAALNRNQEAIGKLKLSARSVFFTNNTPYGDVIAENKERPSGGTFLRPRNFLDPRPVPVGWVEINAVRFMA